MLCVYALVTFLVLATLSCSHRSPNGRGCLLLQNQSTACSLSHFFQENQSQTTLYPTATKKLYVERIHILPSVLRVSRLFPPSTAQSRFIHCSCYSSVAFPQAWPVLLPPRFSSLVVFLLLTFFFFCLTIQPPRSASSSHPALSHCISYLLALQKDCPTARGHTWLLFLLFKHCFFSPFSSPNHPPKHRIAFGKTDMWHLNKEWDEGKIPIPFSNQSDNPRGPFALSLLLSQASPCILEIQTLPLGMTLPCGMLGFLSSSLFNRHILLLPLQLRRR